MPAILVLPLQRSTVGVSNHESHHEVRLLQVMADRDELPEFDASGQSKDGQDPSKIAIMEEIQTEGKTIAEKKDDSPTDRSVSPTQFSTDYPQAFPSHLTPQPAGYYQEYTAYQYQVTPEPPSPSAGGHVIYDMSTVLQQPTGFVPFPTSVRGAIVPGHTPRSPSQNSVPPASPLFPRVTRSVATVLDPNRMHDGSSQRGGYANAQSGRYLSPVYPTMNGYATVAGIENGVGESFVGWGERYVCRNERIGFVCIKTILTSSCHASSFSHQVSPYQNSPQIGAQGIPMPFVPGMPHLRSASVSSRSYSFGDDSMLPPPADGQSHDPYAFGQHSPSGVQGTIFQQQPAAWGYGAPPPDMYGASANPLQPRSATPYTMAAPPRHNGPPVMAPYGQFFPASSPGPPIQMTTSNKGPDGANLFIFHIPNHFTNLDMYQLFCPYGNLLSVRIMVEKDTGRSRGFGFVSYDSPEASALAIKELNGFAVRVACTC